MKRCRSCGTVWDTKKKECLPHVLKQSFRYQSMTNFVLVPFPNYIRELLRLVPSFAASLEYKNLDQTDRTITGVVFSTFARFMEASYGDRQVIDECVSAIEHFVTMNDPEAEHYL